MKLSILKSTLIATLFAFTTISVNAVEKVVALVDGIPIMNSQVQKALGKKANTPENRQKALDSVIDDLLVEKAISDSNVKISNAQIEAVVEQVAAENGLTYGQFLDALDYQGIGINKFKQQIAHQLLMSAVRNQSIEKSISITPEQVQALGNELYEQAKQSGKLKTHTAPEYLVKHILVKTNPILTDAKAKALLTKVRSDILTNKTTFAEAAQKYSKDYLSGADGGSLGWSFPEKYVPEFQKVMTSTKIGTISLPFKTEFGWHILQVDDKRDGDKTQEAYRQQAYQQLVNKQANEVSQNWVKTLRQQAEIKILN